jgi:hypothetical protein
MVALLMAIMINVFDENLPIINKTKHSTKEEKKVQDGKEPKILLRR